MTRNIWNYRVKHLPRLSLWSGILYCNGDPKRSCTMTTRYRAMDWCKTALKEAAWQTPVKATECDRRHQWVYLPHRAEWKREWGLPGPGPEDFYAWIQWTLKHDAIKATIKEWWLFDHGGHPMYELMGYEWHCQDAQGYIRTGGLRKAQWLSEMTAQSMLATTG